MVKTGSDYKIVFDTIRFDSNRSITDTIHSNLVECFGRLLFLFSHLSHPMSSEPYEVQTLVSLNPHMEYIGGVVQRIVNQILHPQLLGLKFTLNIQS